MTIGVSPYQMSDLPDAVQVLLDRIMGEAVDLRAFAHELSETPLPPWMKDAVIRLTVAAEVLEEIGLRIADDRL